MSPHRALQFPAYLLHFSCLETLQEAEDTFKEVKTQETVQKWGGRTGYLPLMQLPKGRRFAQLESIATLPQLMITS